MRLNHPIVLLTTVLAVSQAAGIGFSADTNSSFNPPQPATAAKPVITRYKAHSLTGNKGKAKIATIEQVKAFIRHNAPGVSGKTLAEQFVFAEKQPSLTADHYVFNQVKDGIPVDGGKLIVTVDAKTGQVTRTYRQLVTGKALSAKGMISRDAAYDSAWRDLWVSGKLLGAPKIKLTYHKVGKNLVPVYKSFLYTSAPSGAWQSVIDARTGKVLSHEDTRIFTKPRNNPKSFLAQKRQFGKLADRHKAFARFALAAMPKVRKAQNFYNSTQFSGFVFDPDPRTTSGDDSIRNDSPAAVFASQYKQVTLRDLATNANGDFILQGPWVKIIDFEQPNEPKPSTNPTGAWDAKRDSKAFSEVMVYHHIDQNQRYIQSLFAGNAERRIQFKAIEADANGVEGADNSHFIPSSNRLAFGHGCVPDPEDTDVVLHEYGHAIQHDINPSWNGGDTGAMGEGFGDYWAGSYSLAAILKNNLSAPMDGFVTNVFNWDGHGGEECWAGRKLTNKDVEYDPTRRYTAHSTIPGGVSDELWSAPLFLALLDVVGEQSTLEAKLDARRTMDTIILESHFGLGGNITMRMMGNATIDAAIKLTGDESPHTLALKKWFQFFKITQDPKVRLTLADIAMNTDTLGANGAADPGEEVGFTLEVANMGRNSASDVDGTVGAGVGTATMYENYATYGSIGGRGTAKGSNDYTLAISPDHPCGEPLVFNISMDYQENGTWKNIQMPFSIGTGVADIGSAAAAPGATVPDANDAGISSTTTIRSDAFVDENFTVGVNVSHPYSADLTIELVSPKGTRVILHNQTGGAKDNVITTYPTETKPHESLAKFYGEPLAGDWQLVVRDGAKEDVGTFNSWSLQYVNAFICSSRK